MAHCCRRPSLSPHSRPGHSASPRLAPQTLEESLTLAPGCQATVLLRVVPLQPGQLSVDGVAWTLNGTASGLQPLRIPQPSPHKPGSSSRCGDSPGQLCPASRSGPACALCPAASAAHRPLALPLQGPVGRGAPGARRRGPHCAAAHAAGGGGCGGPAAHASRGAAGRVPGDGAQHGAGNHARPVHGSAPRRGHRAGRGRRHEELEAGRHRVLAGHRHSVGGRAVAGATTVP